MPNNQALWRVRFQDSTYIGLAGPDGVFQPWSGWPWEVGSQPFGNSFLLSKAKILVPVLPSKIAAIGLNYKSHAREMGMDIPAEPILFLKAPTTLTNPGDSIRKPGISERVDFEGELALVIGRTAKNVNENSVWDYIWGFTLANDITARDLQHKDGQWTRAKNFDGFCPLGPSVIPGRVPENFSFQTACNGRIVQNGHLSDMIFSIPKILAFVTQVMTLNPGDVIITGTPPGIAPWEIGQEISITAPIIGQLINKLVTQA
jgi:2-keto-4-pentenoate hydratase/2-oxohepta-3-ene-1,7-dioic acid hydratase in catechol pathway